MLQNNIEWLQTKVFPEAVDAQSFGADVKKFISFEPSDQKGIDHFRSEVVFGDVTVKKENGQLITESVVIKFQPAFKLDYGEFNSDIQFHNEVLFYSEIIPLFRKYDTDNILAKNFCEFVCGKATCGQNPKEDVIILKNLHEKGFKLTKERLFLDEKHVKLALKTLAKYHALSLKCQSDDPVGFHNIVSKIKSVHKDEEITPINQVAINTSRGIDPLKDNPKYKDRLSGIYKHCQEAGDWLEKHSSLPEHLNVIVHGDFTRKNMMFKYGSNGEPTEVVFFDMDYIKYCSPAIDISYFLFLSTSPQTRSLHWDNFLQTYYDSLSNQLDGHPAKPSFEEVELDLRRKGMYGYRRCAFVLPFMMEFKKKEDLVESFRSGKLVLALKEAGGPKTTEYLAEMVKHMLDKNFIF